jgi:hypothetical protein
MAFSFQEYLMSLPGAGRVQVHRNPADRPSYYDDMRFLNKAGGYTGIGLQATLPVVMNNLQYAEPWIDTANAYIDYSRALGGVNNYLTGAEFLGNNGAMYFDQTFRPGTQLGLATNMALGQVSPYLNIARGLGGLTANEANPYGAIPVIREFNQGLDKVVTGMNRSPFGQFMGRMGGGVYDNTIGRLYGMDNGFFRGVGNIASIPGEVINTGGNVLSGLGGLIREGYQAIDRNVFDNVLPGGSDPTDEESMQFDNPFEENPAEGLVDAVTDVGDSFKNLSTLEYEGFDDANRAIIDRYVEKGIPMEDAVAIMNAEQQQIATSGEGYANPADAIRYAEIDYTPEEIEYYSGLMQQAMADPAQNPFLNEDYDIDEPYVPPTSPEDQAIIDQGVADLEEQAGDLADVVIDPTPDEPLTEEDLFDMNSLSDEVLDMLENDMYSELSIDEMQKFADMMGYETPEGMLNLTDQEKLSIAEQYGFDEGQYKEHLNELEQMDIDARNEFNQQDYIESVSGLHGLNRQMEYVAGQIDDLLTSDDITDEKISMATKYLQDLRAFEDKELFQGLANNTNEEFVQKYQEKIDTYKSDIRTKIDETNTKFANAYKTQYETKLSDLTDEFNAIRGDYKLRTGGLRKNKHHYTPEQKERANEILAEIEQLKIDAEVYTNVNDFVDNLYDEMTTDTGAVRTELLENIDEALGTASDKYKRMALFYDVNESGERLYSPDEIKADTSLVPTAKVNNLSETISAEDIIRTMDNMTPDQIANYRPAQIQVNDYISTYNPATDQYSIDYDMIGNTSVSSGIDLRNASTLANASAQQETARQADLAKEIARQDQIVNAITANQVQNAMDTMNRIELMTYRPSTIDVGGFTSTYNRTNDTYSIPSFRY